MNLIIDFLEEYKRLDKLCRDCFSSTQGISEYIKKMESTSFISSKYVHSWDEDYNQLKHIRWVRNQLSHDIGSMYSNVCTEADLDWVKSFYNRIINGNDPFSVIRKAKKEKILKQREKTKNTTSFLDKIITNIKDFFS